MKKRNNAPERLAPDKVSAPVQPRPTTLARVRLLVFAVLLAGWLGWLAYLAATVTHPVVLSRAQFLVSTLDVLAEVPAVDGHPGSDVVIKEVHWPATGHAGLVGKTITVTNLSQRLNNGRWSAPRDWRGAGEYILPLIADGEHYRVAPIPPSPGHEAPAEVFVPRIYPVTPETLHQLKTMPKDVAAS